LTEYQRMTGALTRDQVDPGPISNLWFVFEDGYEAVLAQDVLRRVVELNPGVKIHYIPSSKVERGTKPAQRAALARRLANEGVDAVLASNGRLYESFRSLRDAGYALSTPFGFTGRRFVSVDMPRRSLDPARLSDARFLPHRSD